ncbi:MAG: prepilin-type N-terminal cleavage/methylation domain-containing protein [Eubacterium sp.]|nr:prepilin-type N-terminal cleavage/methylation domain-containing protein [Eubacterium sp.]
MLKRKPIQSNKGFTLVELIITVAIMTLIGVAMVGIMSSNTVAFRKTKSDLDVQNVAQDTYNKISNDLMQAKAVYIEGYKPGDVDFDSNKVGGSAGVGTGSLLKYSNDGDINMRKDKDSNSWANYVPTGSELQALKTLTDEKFKNKVITVDEKDDFYSYYFKARYMTDEEKMLYEDFLQNVSLSAQSFDLLRRDAVGSTQKYSFDDIYVTKMVISYLTPYNLMYKDSSNMPQKPSPFPTMVDIPTGDLTDPNKIVYDICTVTYTFEKDPSADRAIVHVKTDYKYMDLDSDEVYTDYLNFRAEADGSNFIPGVKAQFDSANDAVKLTMYFARNERKYISEGMIKFRNSNVLQNAK